MTDRASVDGRTRRRTSGPLTGAVTLTDRRGALTCASVLTDRRPLTCARPLRRTGERVDGHGRVDEEIALQYGASFTCVV